MDFILVVLIFFFWKNQKSFKHCLISEVVNQTEYCALGQKQSDD